MNNISTEIIPYYFYFVAIIFYVAISSNNKRKKNRNQIINEFSVEEIKIRSFLEDAESKLKALNELYKDNLIELELYTKKTAQIGKIVDKLVTNDVYQFGEQKNKQIINDLKIGIFEKFEDNTRLEPQEKNSDLDIETLLSSIDSKIKKNQRSTVGRNDN